MKTKSKNNHKLKPEYRFRQIPYIKCSQCLSTQRLKCQGCLIKMLNELSDKNHQKKRKAFDKYRATMTKNKLLRRSLADKMEDNCDKFELTNNYERWMQEVSKRQQISSSNGKRKALRNRKMDTMERGKSYNTRRDLILQGWQTKYLKKLIEKKENIF